MNRQFQNFYQIIIKTLKNPVIGIFVILAALANSCVEEKTNSLTFAGMGTVLSVIYTGEKKDEIEKLLKEDIEHVEQDFSYYKKESHVSIINEKAASEDVVVPSHVCELIEKSLNFGKETGGVFDIAYKSRSVLWEEGRKPDEEQIDEKNELMGLDLVKTDCIKNIVRFKNIGVKIDLGGIAKGYAIDRAGEILKKNGISNFIVNYGGDMLVCGRKGKKPWKVGIKDPEDANNFYKTLDFYEDGCTGVATSGDYERFFVIDGKKYSHIFDPRTGSPVANARSVTAVARDAITADVAATAISVVIGEEELIKKIMEKLRVKIYTLPGSDVK